MPDVYKPMKRGGRDIGKNRQQYCSSHPTESDTTRQYEQHRRAHYSTSVSKMTADELTALYEELSYPSAVKFRKAVQKRGESIYLKDAIEFVKTYG